MARLLLAAQAAGLALAQTVWIDALDIGVGGRGFPGNSGNATYYRLPPNAAGVVPPSVWQWGQCSSGMFVQFSTNAATVSIKYQLLSANTSVFSNFPPTGFSGADLYRWDGNSGAWRWVATSMDGLGVAPSNGGLVVESPMLTDTVGWPVGPASPYATLNTTYRYRLHFPSYNGITSMAVGVPTGAVLLPDTSWNTTTPPVLYYGTSIAQGGLSPRPGDTFVNRLSRSLAPSVNNLAFCGACRMELTVASFLVQVPTSLFVVDCGHNMDPATVRANAVPFVTYVRQHIPPSVPIVLVEPTDVRPSWILTDGVYNVTGRRAELYAAYQQLLAAGVGNLQYIKGPSLFSNADSVTEELTFEGVHPLDRGHFLMYQTLEAALTPLLEGSTVTVEQWPVKPAPVTAEAVAAAEAVPGLADLLSQPGPFDLLTGLPADATSSSGSAAPGTAATVVYTDARNLVIRGRAFPESALARPYNRLPAAAQGVVRPVVWSLSTNSAGMLVGFTTAAPNIWVNYTTADAIEPMTHFPASGISGLDLWAWDEVNAEWRFACAVNVPYGTHAVSQQINPPGSNLTDPTGTPRKYMLFLPTYNEALSVLIGVEEGQTLAPYDPLPRPTVAKPVVWYGTSILQGGVSFKVGNIFTSRISRAINREIFNFGFSGNGQMEIPVASYLSIINMSVFIIDCVWNMEPDTIANRTVPLVQYIRSVQGADLPIILAEGTPFGRNWAVPAVNEHQVQDGQALFAAYQQLVASGDKNVYYVPSSALFGAAATLDSGTAVGLHPTDSGMHDVAQLWIQQLTKILPPA